MNDSFFEESVARQSAKGQEALTKASLIIACVCGFFALAGLATAVYVLCITMIIPTAIFLGLFFYYTNNTNLEYEYTFIDGTIEIAKIIDKSRRKSVLKIEVQEIMAFGSKDADGLKSFEHKSFKTVDCSARDGQEQVVLYHSSSKNEDVKVLVNFSDRMVKAISRTNPRCIQK